MAKEKDNKDEKKIKIKSNKLLDIALDIQNKSAVDSNQLGFHPHIFIKTVLPHSKVNGQTYEKENDNWKLFISSPEGIPYGTVPRLLLNFVITEAIRTKSREIDVGKNLSQFMRKVGLSTDGKTMKRFKEQSNALFGSTISIKYKNKDEFTNIIFPIASAHEFWWQDEESRQHGLFSSMILLSQDFYDLIIKKNIPVDLRAVKGIRRSSLSLDIYPWLTNKYYSLDKRVFIPWDKLQFQFGVGYKNNYRGRYKFKENFKKALENVLEMYPEANLSIEKDGLILFPSPTHIPPKNKVKKLKNN